MVGTCVSLIFAAYSTMGLTRPFNSILTVVRRVIWPMIRLIEIPARKPTNIGRERKFATKPSPKTPATKQRMPTSTANAVVKVTRSAAVAAPREVRTLASMMQVAASGPTMSCRDGPNIA